MFDLMGKILLLSKRMAVANSIEDKLHRKCSEQNLDREPSPHPAAGSRRKNAEDRGSLERANSDQRHHDCGRGKSGGRPHSIASNSAGGFWLQMRCFAAVNGAGAGHFTLAGQQYPMFMHGVDHTMQMCGRILDVKMLVLARPAFRS